MKRLVFAAALAALLVPAAASAQGGYRFELTPQVGYRFGGEIEGGEDALFGHHADGVGDDTVRTLGEDEMLAAPAGPVLPARDHHARHVLETRPRRPRVRYSGSGRSWSDWQLVQIHVRIRSFVWMSRRRVHGMRASRPHASQRSGRAPGGSTCGSQGTFAGIARS